MHWLHWLHCSNQVTGYDSVATVKFAGAHEQTLEPHVGVVFDRQIGNTNGTVDGRPYARAHAVATRYCPRCPDTSVRCTLSSLLPIPRLCFFGVEGEQQRLC